LGVFDVINLKQELQDYPAIDLKSLADNVSDIPDNIRNSMILYNKALENLRMDSEDIAIIELKKAVSMNPDFHEAMNLLGLCYLYIREYAKARELFEKVTAAEKNSIRAMKYMTSMNTGETVSASSEQRRKPEAAKKRDNGGASLLAGILKGKLAGREDILRMVVSFTAGALLMFLLSLVFRYSPTELKVSSEIESTQKPSGITDVDVSKLNSEIQRLQEELDASLSEIEYYKSTAGLKEVEDLIAAKNFVAAGDKLKQLKVLEFKEPEKSRVDQLYEEIMPKAALSALNEGNRLYNAKKYQDAVNMLSKIQLYGSDWSNMDKVLYLLGKSYVELKDNTNALETFVKLKKDYPKSQYVKWAEYRIKELSGDN
jgi:tetratricopeptide (TPR) repeat protein